MRSDPAAFSSPHNYSAIFDFHAVSCFMAISASTPLYVVFRALHDEEAEARPTNFTFNVMASGLSVAVTPQYNQFAGRK